MDAQVIAEKLEGKKLRRNMGKGAGTSDDLGEPLLGSDGLGGTAKAWIHYALVACNGKVTHTIR